MDRISLLDRAKLSHLSITEYSYDELKEQVGRALSTAELGKQFDKYFNTMKASSTSKIYEHFLKASEKWDSYSAWRKASQKTPPEEQFFLDKFEESVPRGVRQTLIEKRLVGTISGINSLGEFIGTYKSMWGPEDDTTSGKVLSSQLTTLQKQNDSLKEALETLVREQKEARSIAESARNLNQVTSDNNARLADIVDKQSTSLQRQLNSLEQATRNVQDTVQSEKFSTQRSILDYQGRERASSMYLNNMNSPHFHKDRQNNEGGYRGRDRRSFSPGGRSPDGRGYSSGESRSPSPNPIDNTCFLCLKSHWMIKCPDTTRIEKENELYKLLAKKKNSGRARVNEEEMLRTEYSIPVNEGSQVNINSSKRKAPAPGTGPYCKWCHVKGHATLVCASFCACCEKTGHGWRECKEPQYKAVIEQRNTNFRLAIGKAEKISYRN
jgi:hypothetical protein